MKQFMYSTNDWLYFMDFESLAVDEDIRPTSEYLGRSREIATG